MALEDIGMDPGDGMTAMNSMAKGGERGTEEVGFTKNAKTATDLSDQCQQGLFENPREPEIL